VFLDHVYQYSTGDYSPFSHFVLNWLCIIKNNSDEQVKQNQQMLELLKEINEKLHKE
jgi:hypothetical protein